MNKCVALFTGGKESVFSILKARELGYEVKELLFLKKPGFSVHKVNLPTVKAVAKMLGYELRTIAVSNEVSEDRSLINYLKEQNRRGLNALVSGNVKLEENHEIYASLCEKTGLELIEPLRGKNTLELLIEYSKIGMQFMIIGIRDEELDPGWLGATISKQNIENFVEEVLSKGIDPCGEYGEYHSIVTELKSLGKGLKSTSAVRDESACTSYLLLMNPQIIKTGDK